MSWCSRGCHIGRTWLSRQLLLKYCPARRFHTLYREIMTGIVAIIAATIPTIASIEMAIGLWGSERCQISSRLWKGYTQGKKFQNSATDWEIVLENTESAKQQCQSITGYQQTGTAC
ncbi:hypothetical protein BDV11DRAFT_177950, partial [Aspergillus similis]